MHIMFLTYLFLLQCSAHNWIHGLSRVPKLSMLVPAPPRSGPRQPHRQVGAGQDFVLEFVTGHPGSYYFFVVVKATDEDKLILNTEATLNKYITQAPEDAWLYTAEKYQRTHISCTHNHVISPSGRGDCGQGTWNPGTQYEREVTTDDAFWVDRSAWHPNPGSNMAHFKYKPNDLTRDSRVSYFNADFHWIEAVHKIRVNYRWPKEWDAMRLSLPGRGGSGEYMVHMVWRGYRDVVDIDVLPAPANDIYGRQASIAEFVKMEHCQYTKYVARNARCFYYQSGDSVQNCLDDCAGNRRCKAVNVVPVFTPEAVKIQGHEALDANVPWQAKGGSKRCKHNQLPGNADENTLVCYGFIPSNPEDPAFNSETESQWYIRDTDPEDPIFYSSCYRQLQKREFVGNPECPVCEGESAVNQPKWQIGDKCMSCEDVEAQAEAEFSEVKLWDVSNVCDKCF